ncbi:hypothetical protein PRIPAC_78945 [Pristionchus pacificus]|uniref:Uncharacterized protein n=1 Tax=Pristionchus pacificus TaxID=54126 RepID=A0A2A6CMQ1_PRIPA|nr:hypothetical protein PRIPAC_78945 [Pristionchus pacificus]|eukprot:PDM79333.1 hypothetical protein PRIPAC_31912 [Pristionchus pacificus]
MGVAGVTGNPSMEATTMTKVLYMFIFYEGANTTISITNTESGRASGRPRGLDQFEQSLLLNVHAGSEIESCDDVIPSIGTREKRNQQLEWTGSALEKEAALMRQRLTDEERTYT